MDSCSVVEWRNLPKDMLSTIAERSEIRILRAVCSSWRSSLTPSPTKSSPLFSINFPLLPNIDNESFESNDGAFFGLGLTQRTIFCLEPLDAGKITNEQGSRSSLMVKLEESSSGKLDMVNTISGLPSPDLKGHSKFPAVLNLLNFRVMQVGKEYNLRCKHAKAFAGLLIDLKIRVCKVVMSESNDAILCIFGEGKKLGCFKFGDGNWTVIDDGNANISEYSDIVYHRGKFYAIQNSGKIGLLDLSLKIKEFLSPVRQDRVATPNLLRLNYFVQSNGNLFVVKRYYHDSFSYGLQGATWVLFKVYRLNENKKEWVEVTHLDDQTFFIGHECCFSVSTKYFSGCKKNCIYFTDFACAEGEYDGDPGFDVGIFVLKNNSSERIRRYSKYSHIFWPFQEWLMVGGESSKPSS